MIQFTVPVPTMTRIIREVADQYGISTEDLEGRSPAPKWSHPRHEAMWRIRQVKRANGKPRYSFPTIARRFNQKNHTSALYGVIAHEARMNGEPHPMDVRRGRVSGKGEAALG